MASAVRPFTVTKNPVVEGKSIRETVVGALFDYFANMGELFSKRCGFLLPRSYSEEEFLAKGPAVAIILHPALGPLWSIVAQKIQKGTLHENAELILDLEALYIANLSLTGTLMIQALKPLGMTNEEGDIIFSEKTTSSPETEARCSPSSPARRER